MTTATVDRTASPKARANAAPCSSIPSTAPAAPEFVETNKANLIDTDYGGDIFLADPEKFANQTSRYLSALMVVLHEKQDLEEYVRDELTSLARQLAWQVEQAVEVLTNGGAAA